MDVEGNILGLHVRVLVGETVDVFTVFLGLDLDRAVGGIGESLDDLSGRRLDPEVTVELFCGISVSVTDLEGDCQFVLAFQRLEEALLPPWREKSDVCKRLCYEQEGEQEGRCSELHRVCVCCSCLLEWA